MSNRFVCDCHEKVFQTLEKRKTHVKNHNYRQSERLTGMFRCDPCQKIFSNDVDVIKHEASQKHAKWVRKLNIDSNPDLKDQPNICSICDKRYTQPRGLRVHLKTNFHAKRFRHHFNQTIRIMQGYKAQSWDEKRSEEKTELNRLRQAKFRKIKSNAISGLKDVVIITNDD